MESSSQLAGTGLSCAWVKRMLSSQAVADHVPEFHRPRLQVRYWPSRSSKSFRAACTAQHQRKRPDEDPVSRPSKSEEQQASQQCSCEGPLDPCFWMVIDSTCRLLRKQTHRQNPLESTLSKTRRVSSSGCTRPCSIGLNSLSATAAFTVAATRSSSQSERLKVSKVHLETAGFCCEPGTCNCRNSCGVSCVAEAHT